MPHVVPSPLSKAIGHPLSGAPADRIDAMAGQGGAGSRRFRDGHNPATFAGIVPPDRRVMPAPREILAKWM